MALVNTLSYTNANKIHLISGWIHQLEIWCERFSMKISQAKNQDVYIFQWFKLEVK